MQQSRLRFEIDSILGSSTNCVQLTAYAQGCLLYVAGCNIVLYHPLRDQQISYIQHRTADISSIVVSHDEQYLAVAESGKHPHITVYAIQTAGKDHTKKALLELKGHKHRIDGIVFSPNRKYIVSVCNQEGSMFLWQGEELVAKNRLTKTINKVMFDSAQNLITVGRGYFKLWKFNEGEAIRRLEEDCWMIDGRVINFGKKFSTKDFIDAAVYRANTSQVNLESDRILLLAADGFLCLLRVDYDSIDKWIDLMMERTTCLCLWGSLALCAGDNALVKAIDLPTLSLKAKFPKPPPTNKENIALDQIPQYSENEQFPQCIGVRTIGQMVMTLYSNRAMFIWRLGENIQAIRSVLTHREKISSVCLLQEIKGDISFFATAAHDHTVRIWHYYKKQHQENMRSVDVAEIIGIKRNVYCRNLTQIIYTHSEHPIIAMQMYCAKFIACISLHEFIMYSLEDFELTAHENFEAESVANRNINRSLLSLAVAEELIYIGAHDGTLRIFKLVGDSLQKMRQVRFQFQIQILRVYSRKNVLVCGKGRSKCWASESGYETPQLDAVLLQLCIECCEVFEFNLVVCESRTVHFLSINKQKRLSTMSLTHEVEQNEKVRLIKATSWLIMLVTDSNRLLVVNWAATILYIEQINEPVSDIAITESGQIIIVGENSLLIKCIHSDQQLQKMERMKKWFEQQDVMDGSVWSSRKESLQKKSVVVSSGSICLEDFEKIKDNQPKSFTQRNSIDFDFTSDRSIGLPAVNLPNIAIQYKTGQNTTSVFNPSSVCQQVNKIFYDMDNLLKNRPEKHQAVQKKQDDDLQVIHLEASKPKRRIFQQDRRNQKQSPYVPPFATNLVLSVIGSELSASAVVRNSKNNLGDSIRFGMTEVNADRIESYQLVYTISQHTYQEKTSFSDSIKRLLNNHETLRGNKQQIQAIINEHPQSYAKLYELLKISTEQEQSQKIQNIKQKYVQLSKEFMAYVDRINHQP